ncbi:jacalin-like lectin [Parabacteroides goldsteinii]|uniref:jacalin-like lectin n=1 Tax=Parabacteroides goldsteinii TaxID=328812 RepID=UPI0032C1D401
MKENMLLVHTLFEGSGEGWSDLIAYQSLGKEKKYKFPTKICLDYVQFIDRIQLVYADKQLTAHGCEAGNRMEITFDAEEYIQSVTCEYCPFGQSAHMICTLLFKTNKREWGFRSFYQPANKTSVTYTLPNGFALSCMAGRTDHYNKACNPCIAGLKLFASPIQGTSATAYGVLNNDFTYLKLTTSGLDLTEDIDYTFELFTRKETLLACAYIKGMENDVTFTVIGKNGTPLEKGGDAQSMVSTWNDQTVFILNNPVEEVWQLHVKAKKGSKFDMSVYAKNSLLPIREEMKYANWVTLLSDQTMTLQKMAQTAVVAMEELAARQLEQPTGRQALAIMGPTALLHLRHLCAFWAPNVAVGLIVVIGASYLIYKVVEHIKKEHKDADFKADVEKGIHNEKAPLYNRPGFWVWRPSVDVYQNLDGWRKEYPAEFECTPLTRSLYEAIYERFDKDIEVSHVKKEKYIDAQFLSRFNNYLHVDIGGEGCHLDHGVRYGFSTAIVLSGRKSNYYVDRDIPMLLHVNDWEKDSFPFQDGVVTRFTMEGLTSQLTKNEADEIVRCINKSVGRIELWTPVADKENNLLVSFFYIADKLKCGYTTQYREPSYGYIIDLKTK